MLQNHGVAALPEWITNIGPCTSLEICVVGSGESLRGATINGRSELAKFFETRVKVDATFSNQTIQNGLSISQAQYDEWSSKTIQEAADEFINGIETKRSENIDGTFYVLLSLPKEKAAQNFKEKIQEIDQQNNALFKKGTRLVYPLIILNLKKRDYYVSRYNLVSSQEIKSSITPSKMIEVMDKLSPIRASVFTDKEKLPASVSHMLEKIFSPLKIIFVSSKQNPSYKLRTKLAYEDQYFKVEGFKKLNVIFKIELSEKDKVLGRISSSSIQTARSKEKALEMALDDIENDLKENLDQLASDKQE